MATRNDKMAGSCGHVPIVPVLVPDPSSKTRARVVETYSVCDPCDHRLDIDIQMFLLVNS